MRTVALRWGDDWYNFGTNAQLVPGRESLAKSIKIREDVMLLEHCSIVRGALSVNRLTKLLKRWRAVTGASAGMKFQEGLDLRREPSNVLKATWPAWKTTLRELSHESRTPSNAEGPFLHVGANIFGQDLPALARQYLGDGGWSGQHSASHEYVLTIPDHRVRISELNVKDNQLRLEIENPDNSELYACIVAVSPFDERFNRVQLIEKNSAQQELPFVPQVLEIWITLPDGYALDHYVENEYFSTWGKGLSLFRGARSGQALPISHALRAGESDTVEFKPYILLNGKDPKQLEILRTVSAFANQLGGDLYFGVTDLGEVEALRAGLARDYGAETMGSLERQKKCYERDLKRLINTLTAPTLALTFHWHDYADELVLQLSVPKSSELVHFQRTGELYKRAGATNMKWRPVDAATSLRAKKSRQ